MKRKLLNAVICIFLLLIGLPFTAKAADSGTGGKTIYVDFQHTSAGSGSKENPYKYFDAALKAANDGDTIIIGPGGADAAVESGNELTPVVLDKKITITSESEPGTDMPQLDVRRAGILLEADVTFRNVTISLMNRCYAAIFANGHKLELDNVYWREGQTRKVHLFGGNLYVIGGEGGTATSTPHSKNSGTHGQIIISGSVTKVGNIYAGSMNGEWDHPTTITVNGTANMKVGTVYGSGALQGQYDENQIFLGPEPTDPEANATQFPMNGEVTLNLSGTAVGTVEGSRNPTGTGADVIYSTEYPSSNVSFADIGSLTVKSGTLQPAALNQNVDVSVNAGATLNLSTVTEAAGNSFSVGDFAGGGMLILNPSGILSINGKVSGSTEFRVTDSISTQDSSGRVKENHGYIDVTRATGDGVFTFTPYFTQSSMKLEKVNDVWTAIDSEGGTTNTQLDTFDLIDTEMTATVAEIDHEYGVAFEASCSFTNPEEYPDLGEIPFSYEVALGSQTYNAKSKLVDGYYEASIPILNMRFLASGDDVNGAHIYIMSTGSTASVYKGAYTIKITAPTTSGNVVRTLKLTVTDAGGGTDTDTTAPVISKCEVGEIGTDSAVITVEALDDSGSVEYALAGNGDIGSAVITETAMPGVFRISGLSPSTSYSFTATVSDSAGNTSEQTITFTTAAPAKIDLGTATVTVGGTYTYDGTPKIPQASDVEVRLGGSVVSRDQYTFTASNNVNAGTAVLTVQGQGQHTGSATGQFTIGKGAGAGIDAVTGSYAVSAEDESAYSYFITVIAGAEYRMDDGEWQDSNIFSGIAPETSHTFYARQKETANTLAGEPASTGEVSFPAIETVPVDPDKIDLSEAIVTVNGTYTYDGTPKVPQASDVEVRLNDSVVSSDQYTFTASNNINAGTAVLTVQGQDQHTGRARGSFTIGKGAGAEIAAVSGSYAVSTEDESKYTYFITVIAGAEYRMDDGEWQDSNVFSGIAPETSHTFYARQKETANTFAGAAASTGAVSFPAIEIGPIEPEKIDLSTAVVTVNGTYTYNGNPQVPQASQVEVKLNNAVVAGSQYTFTATNNVNAGTAILTVQGQDGYTGSATGRFTIGKGAGAEIAEVKGSYAVDETDDNTYVYTITAIAGAEYKMDDGQWQDGNVFSGIAPETSHTFYARQKETANTLAGTAASTGAVSFPAIKTEPVDPPVNPNPPNPPAQDVDKSKLKLLIAQAEEAAASDKYTDASVQNLQAETDQAKAVLEAAGATQEEVTAAEGRLAEALGLLEEKKPEEIPFPFTDVEQIVGHWKYDNIKYVYENKIMNGISGTTLFRPDGQLTRAMFATVLYRMAGEPAMAYSTKFTDVADGQWYSKAILWANDKGIVDGYTDGSYGINDNITREQIAKMLYLYGTVQGYQVSDAKELDSFTDADSVSGWAVDYMKWATAVEMITGKPNEDGSYRLDPKGEATRAECAKMLRMFLEKYEAGSEK